MARERGGSSSRRDGRTRGTGARCSRRTRRVFSRRSRSAEGTIMTLTTTMKLGAAATLLVGVTTATADYHTHPELKPSSRCGTALQKNPLPNPGNIESLENYTTDCQPLYWDLPATVQLHVPVRAAYDPITGFLHGPTEDRKSTRLNSSHPSISY